MRLVEPRWVAVDGRLAGLVGVADPIKDASAAALAQLRADGIEIVMLTGDHRATAEVVGAALGIARIEAEVLPQDKQRVVDDLRAQGRTVAMAGDGVNDGPCAGRRRCRHRAGHRHRRRDRERRHHPAKR